MSEPIVITLPYPPKEGWTREKDDALRNLYGKYPLGEIAVRLGHTLSAVRNRRWRLKIAVLVPPWNDSEIAILKDWYASRVGKALDLDRLASQLGRHKTNVSRKARELGLTEIHREYVEKINGRYVYRLPKYTNDTDRRKAVSVRTRKWIAENGHPRGALGMKHSKQTKDLIAAISKERMAAMSPEEKRRNADKAIQTKLARYGTGGPPINESSNPHSRCKGGRRSDLGGMYFRSAWEANYARYLNWLISLGKIARWEYEKKTFRFPGIKRGSITYTPDFLVVENDGTERYHEVKGWMTKQSKTRLKRMAKYFPEVEIVLIGEKQYRQIAKVAAGLVPHWE